MKSKLLVSTIVLGILLCNPCFVYGRNDFSPETLTAAQADWSYLGDITYYYKQGDFVCCSDAELYVKVISGKAFYQVRSSYGGKYTVVKGSFQLNGKCYNAMFGDGNYFNLP
ncbi:MAG TPA: hypothetical protein DHU75_01330 [Rikenellaceae bacterium]|nr:hypothetical protein [Rikenellaceae bacterium]